MPGYKRIKSAIVATSATSLLVMAQPVLAADPDVTPFTNFFNSAVKTMLAVVSSIAIVFFVYGFIKYMTSSGNPQHMEEAKSTLKTTLYGLIGSYMAIALIGGLTVMLKNAFGN